MVQHWGLVSVEAVAERARALAPHWGASASIASRLLEAAPSTRWLDGPDRRWFSLTAPTSQLEITVRKILSVATSVRIEDLRDGLTKAVPAVAAAPYGVLEQYLRQIVGCTVDGATVLAPTGLAVSRGGQARPDPRSGGRRDRGAHLAPPRSGCAAARSHHPSSAQDIASLSDR